MIIPFPSSFLSVRLLGLNEERHNRLGEIDGEFDTTNSAIATADTDNPPRRNPRQLREQKACSGEIQPAPMILCS